MEANVAKGAHEDWIQLRVPALPWHVEVHVDTLHGVAVMTGMRLSPRPGIGVRATVLDSHALRAFPLVQVQEALSRALLAEFERSERPPEFKRPFPQEHYEWVATAYDVAVEAGQAPVKFVAEYFGKSHGTAKKYVTEARRRKLIVDGRKRTAGHARRGVGRKATTRHANES